MKKMTYEARNKKVIETLNLYLSDKVFLKHSYHFFKNFGAFERQTPYSFRAKNLPLLIKTF